MITVKRLCFGITHWTVAWALRYSVTSGAHCQYHLGWRISIALALQYSITSGARYYCHLRKENINSLGAAVQHNFRRPLLLPSRDENFSSQGAAVQHNRAPLKSIGSGDVSMAIDPLPPIGGTR